MVSFQRITKKSLNKEEIEAPTLNHSPLNLTFSFFCPFEDFCRRNIIIMGGIQPNLHDLCVGGTTMTEMFFEEV
jgi:hypothetical protein